MENLNKVLIVGINSSIGSAVLDIYHENKYVCFGTYNKSTISLKKKDKCSEICQCDLTNTQGIEKLLKFCKK